MCNNKDFFERQQVEMLLSAELALSLIHILIQAAALDCRGAEILPRKAALARLVAE